MTLFLAFILLLLAWYLLATQKPRAMSRKRVPYTIQSERYAGMMPVSAVPTLRRLN